MMLTVTHRIMLCMLGMAVSIQIDMKQIHPTLRGAMLVGTVVMDIVT